jgi:HEAT repeat protein
VTFTLDPEKARRLSIELARTMAAAGEAERAQAVREFSALRGDRVAEALAPHVASETGDTVRIALAEGLGASGSPAAVKPLIDMLDKPRRRPLVTKAAAEALARTGDPRAVDPLFKLLHQPDVATAQIGLDACVLLLRSLRDGPSVERALSRFIGYYEWLDPHALPNHLPQTCATHHLYAGLYDRMRAAMAALTEYNHDTGAEYRIWWNRNKEGFLRARTGPRSAE